MFFEKLIRAFPAIILRKRSDIEVGCRAFCKKIFFLLLTFFVLFFPVASPAEAQIQNMPSACAGYQLARDPVSGQIMLIPANQIGKNFQASSSCILLETTDRTIFGGFINFVFSRI